MKLLEYIFSVTNSEDKRHKIVTMLGLKIKFKVFGNKYIIQNILLENNRLIKENQYLLNMLTKRMAMLDIPLNYKKYWTEDNLLNIIPGGYGKYPEGFNPGEVINKEILKDISYNTIVDFGCGYGRLSENFSPKKYIGIDLNPKAIEKAKENNPEYKYYEVDINSEYPKCDVIFAHTVFLHNDDQTLINILKRLNESKCEHIIVSDVISKDWHNGFIPPTYFRSIEDYNEIMKQINFELVLEKHYPYKRYAESPEYQHLNTNITFLLYKRIGNK